MKLKTYNEFINEGNRFGITFDSSASKYDVYKKTTPDKAPKYVGIYDNKDLKKFNVDPIEYKKFITHITYGLKYVRDFVIKTDFSQYGDPKSSNWNDKAFIYHSLTGYLGGYSQYALSLTEIAYIGMEESLKEFEVKNQNWHGKFSGGATEDFPENRPQLILHPKHNTNWYTQDIFNTFPSLINLPRLA